MQNINDLCGGCTTVRCQEAAVPNQVRNEGQASPTTIKGFDGFVIKTTTCTCLFLGSSTTFVQKSGL